MDDPRGGVRHVIPTMANNGNWVPVPLEVQPVSEQWDACPTNLFGKQQKTYPAIIELARPFGRTPSAVAMKLSNFTSLDPQEAKRGISGLSGASKLDKENWSEFESDREQLVEEIELLREKGELDDTESTQADTSESTGSTTQRVQVTQRGHQRFFRRVVLGSYNGYCCVTGLPVPELLRASHIVPWSVSVEQRLNPCNGLCLSATFDAAFNRGLISFDGDYRLLIGSALSKKSEFDEVKSAFLDRSAVQMRLPEKNLPDPQLIGWHRDRIFQR